jgi:hypothetical protein
MKNKIIISKIGLALLMGNASLTISTGNTAVAATEPAPAPMPTYARVADLVTAVPAIASVRAKSVTLIPRERATGLAPENNRFLIAAETMSLIRGNDVLSRDVSFLIDLPSAQYPKAPKWKKRPFLLFGSVSDRVDFFQLSSSNAIFAWSVDVEAMVRRVAGQFAAADVPPAISDINSAFHVQGTVQGEGETQIFLQTAKGSQVSLSIVRRPDEQPQFGAALGEVVDQAASLPEADTPLWYRLACGLPAQLPASALDGQDAAQASAANRDYKAFIDAMAPCNRKPLPIS